MWNPIRMLIFGSISSIKKVVIEKSSTAYNKAKSYVRRGSNVQQEEGEAKYDNNPQPNIIDR